MTDTAASGTVLDPTFWGGQGRADKWRVELWTNRDVYRRELQGVQPSSTLDANAFRDVAAGGNLSIVQPHGKDWLDGIDWLADRVAVTYILEVHGYRVEVPWGVYVAAAEVETTEDPYGLTVQVPLLDKTAVLRQDGIRDHYAVPTNTRVTSTVEAILRSAGELRYAVTPSVERTRTAMAWPAGTPRLTIINDLLTAIGYAAMYADESGVFRADPYVDPDARPVLWDFAGGRYTLTAPPRTTTLRASDIPNRVVVTTQESEGVTALVGIAENNDPNSRYSYARRGRWITHTEEGADATSQAVVNDMAARKLRDSSRPAVRLPLSHLPIPLPLDSAVRAPDGRTMTVIERRVTLQPMVMMSSTLRRFEAV